MFRGLPHSAVGNMRLLLNGWEAVNINKNPLSSLARGSSCINLSFESMYKSVSDPRRAWTTSNDFEFETTFAVSIPTYFITQDEKGKSYALFRLDVSVGKSEWQVFHRYDRIT